MTASIWAQRALEHARRITGIASGRGSATSAERQAAQEVQDQLRGIGINQVQLQEFSGLRSLWLFLGLAFGIALVGHAAYWLLSTPLGSYPALVISSGFFLLSAFMLWRKFSFRDFPLSQALPVGPSQNVLGIIHPQDEVRTRVVLLGHLDSHRAVWVFATDFLTYAFTILTPVATYGVVLAPLLYWMAQLLSLQFLAYPSLVLCAFHFLAWFTGMTADLGPYSPGANDNASAVGTLLSLGERLMQQPLKQTEVWLAFTGCEETGCDGLRQLLAEFGTQLKDAIFLDFEMVGIGERLAYLQTEGIIRKRQVPAKLELFVNEVGASWEIRPTRIAHLGAYTEAGAAWEGGYQAVCIMMQSDEGRRSLEWHRLTDTADRLQAGALEETHAFTWALLQKLDGD